MAVPAQATPVATPTGSAQTAEPTAGSQLTPAGSLPRGPDGVLHRHHHLHRLQGLRGRLQELERALLGRLHPQRRLLRQHAGAERRDLAARPVHRAVPGGSRRRPLAVDERRLQALRPRRLPGGLSDRGHHPHRVRHRRHPGRRLQRLPRLHRGLPLRRDRDQPGLAHGDEVHPLLRPLAEWAGAGLRQGLPDRLDQVRHDRGAASGSPTSACSSSTRRRETRDKRRMPTSTARTTPSSAG